MAGWAAAAQAAAEIGTAWMNKDSQNKANRMNLRLQREQQAWEQQMANTAVQRRKADIEAAGGNPAAAFVTGSAADTPNVSPAVMNPTRLQTPQLGSAIMMATQQKAIEAQTKATEAQAASTSQDAIAKARDNQLKSTKGYEDWTINKWVEEYSQQDLTTKIMQHAETKTGAEAKRMEETVDLMVKQLKQQVEEGGINLDALRNWAKAHGLEAERAVGLLSKLMDNIPHLRAGKSMVPGAGKPRGNWRPQRPGRTYDGQDGEKPDWRHY